VLLRTGCGVESWRECFSDGYVTRCRAFQCSLEWLQSLVGNNEELDRLLAAADNVPVSAMGTAPLPPEVCLPFACGGRARCARMVVHAAVLLFVGDFFSTIFACCTASLLSGASTSPRSKCDPRGFLVPANGFSLRVVGRFLFDGHPCVWLRWFFEFIIIWSWQGP
jgi:hypothetical protein